jgi:hypothetical protein
LYAAINVRLVSSNGLYVVPLACSGRVFDQYPCNQLQCVIAGVILDAAPGPGKQAAVLVFRKDSCILRTTMLWNVERADRKRGGGG